MNLLKENQRIPNEYIYNIFITLILAFAILWLIYIIVPNSHYKLYLINTEQKPNIKKNYFYLSI